MNVRLIYRSNHQFSESFSDFQVKVAREKTLVKVSFKEIADSRYASFSLPVGKAAQLAHATNVQAVLDGTEPINFSVTETSATINVRLRYSSGEKTYWEQLSDFNVAVMRKGTRVKLTLKEKGDSRYFSCSLTLAKAVQLAHAINMHAVSEGGGPIRFTVTETSAKAIAA
jgi:curved DNA-binding protein CbpA